MISCQRDGFCVVHKGGAAEAKLVIVYNSQETFTVKVGVKAKAHMSY